MKKSFFLLLFSLILLSGCAEDNRFDFAGKNENWNVFYIVNVSNGDTQDANGTIKYVGEGQAPEKINYTIKTLSGSSEGTGILLEEGVANAGRSSCEGCAIIQKDEEIEVEITWNGQSEKLVLINKALSN
ncbi:hypothetical protein [Paenisporosarcina sp. TG-14]|uniref:hypothetical protein n=1 Tax=Paenisporosarcina sp. TG-14 TaxID=1231057 RepID=UPI00030CDBE0|nr:hypothetical protein [Paenisporosarcina sp. TG-14]